MIPIVFMNHSTIISYMILKHRCEIAIIDPNKSFLKLMETVGTNDTIENLEDVICALYCGYTMIEQTDFDRLTKFCLNNDDFKTSPEYLYYYHMGCGNYFRKNQNLDAAAGNYENAYRASLHLNDPELVVRSLGALSFSYCQVDDFLNALHYCKQALSYIEGLENPMTAADIYSMYGSILLNSGEIERSLEVTRCALKHYQRTDNYSTHFNYMLCLMNIGKIYHLMDNQELSREYFDNGLAIAEKHEYFQYLLDELDMVAEVYYAAGEYQRAYQYLKFYDENKQVTPPVVEKLNSIKTQDELKKELNDLLILSRTNARLSWSIEKLLDRVDSSSQLLKDRNQMVAAVADALNKGEITAFFQLKWSLKNNNFSSAEALVRWIKQDGEVIPPDVFIDHIKETRIIHDLTTKVIKDAFSFCASIIEHTNPDFKVSINIEPFQLANHDITAIIQREMILSNLTPENIEIEILERTFFDNDAHALEQLEKLRSLGVELALDDFGSGYSSLVSINRLQIDTIKIDKSLLFDSYDSERGHRLLASVVRVMQDLDLKVVVEGVETESHVELVKKLRCDVAQGYYYSRPLPADKVIELIDKRS